MKAGSTGDKIAARVFTVLYIIGMIALGGFLAQRGDWHGTVTWVIAAIYLVFALGQAVTLVSIAFFPRTPEEARRDAYEREVEEDNRRRRPW